MKICLYIIRKRNDVIQVAVRGYGRCYDERDELFWESKH